jgi:hypothetical protein
LNPCGVGGKPVARKLAKECQFIGANVFPFVLCESEKENTPNPRPVRNDHAVPAGAPLSRPGHTLFDEPAAKIGIDQASLGPFDGLTQASVRDPFTPGKAREPSRLEHSHKIA